ncbi:MAG: hypothetical protein E6J90_51430 [Deltaproteobacteria bacterium]|nr:MAG: hypothetical protein E6J90_51430 [Deltaproteobacteria bacterium]
MALFVGFQCRRPCHARRNHLVLEVLRKLSPISDREIHPLSAYPAFRGSASSSLSGCSRSRASETTRSQHRATSRLDAVGGLRKPDWPAEPERIAKRVTLRAV